MSDKQSQSFNRYESWREAFEMRSALAWGFVIVWVSYLGAKGFIPLIWALIVAALSCLRLLWLMKGALAIWMARAALSGQAVQFISIDDLKRKMKNHRHELWLGEGFRWWPEHSQRLYELMKLNWTRLLLPAAASRFLTGKRPLGETPQGLPIIHGVSLTQNAVYRPLDNFEGGLCLCGTTQAGKGVYLVQLVSQAILRGDVVIVIDPKHSGRLKAAIFEACRAAGRQSPLTFHPAFPDEGIRLDPLHSFTNATEVASRVRQVLPPHMDEAFANFAWMAVNAIAQGLIALERRPTLPLIARYIQHGIDEILEELLERHVANFAEPGWDRDPESLKEGFSLPYGANASDRLVALAAYYEKTVRREASHAEIDTLLQIFHQNRDYYAKITTSLIPILGMLTTGPLATSLSSDVADVKDARVVMNLEKVIEGEHVLYIGLEALPNPAVASALAAVWLADLANVAGRRYNLGLNAKNSPRVCLFIDEVANVINRPLIEILNKGAESGINTVCAMQSVADLADRMGSDAAAHVVLANLNNLIALRTKDQMTQNFVASTLGKTYIANFSLSQSTKAEDDVTPEFNAGLTKQMSSNLEALFPTEFLGRLPNCEAIIQVSAGYIYKTCCPILRTDTAVNKEPQK